MSAAILNLDPKSARDLLADLLLVCVFDGEDPDEIFDLCLTGTLLSLRRVLVGIRDDETFERRIGEMADMVDTVANLARYERAQAGRNQNAAATTRL